MTTVRTPEDATLDEALVDALLGDSEALSRAEEEILASGLIEHLEAQAREFWETTAAYRERGLNYNTGRVTGSTGKGYGEGLRLYAILRELHPEHVVETGVCNGVSTAFLLLALEKNGRGQLHSVDLPEFAGVDYDPGTFWDGKQGAVIPQGKEVGWMIPERLREGWEVIIGPSQDELPPLLARVGEIGLFLHDSEHTYEAMKFEFEHAWPALAEGGVLAADDVDANAAWHEFARGQGRESIPLGRKMAFLVK